MSNKIIKLIDCVGNIKLKLPTALPTSTGFKCGKRLKNACIQDAIFAEGI